MMTPSKELKQSLLSPWRRRFQWATSFLVLLLPWIQPGGNSLLRIDIPSLSLHLFGQVLRIEELFLFLLFTLAFGSGFLLTTLVFGRVWCGWACPQTTLNDLAEWGARKLSLKFSDNRLVGAAWRKLLLQFFYLLLAALVSANLIWYFIEPQRFFASLFRGELRFGVALTFAATALLIYLDLALVRRLMCREFCPYGRIQAALVDPGTLTLQLPETEKPRCIKCNSCVRCCPMGIDIRNGYQVECINCGRCLDACRIIMNNRSEPGLIYYTFGSNNLGPSALFNPHTLILGLLLLSLLTGLGFAMFNRAEASLKVSVSHNVASRILNDGQQVTFFNAWLNNRGTEEKSYSLLAKDAAGAPLTLKGQTAALSLSGGANRKIDYVLVTPPVEAPSVVEFLLTDEQRNVLARARAQILPITRN